MDADLRIPASSGFGISTYAFTPASLDCLVVASPADLKVEVS